MYEYPLSHPAGATNRLLSSLSLVQYAPPSSSSSQNDYDYVKKRNNIHLFNSLSSADSIKFKSANNAHPGGTLSPSLPIKSEQLAPTLVPLLISIILYDNLFIGGLFAQYNTIWSVLEARTQSYPLKWLQTLGDTFSNQPNKKSICLTSRHIVQRALKKELWCWELISNPCLPSQVAIERRRAFLSPSSSNLE